MKHFIILFLLALFVGCATLDGVRTKNRENLSRLSVGMEKEQVLEIMGTKTQTLDWNQFLEKINNPYRTEIYEDSDENTYEILFYYSDIKRDDKAITDDELTPLIIKDNKLIGWGWSFWNDRVTKYQMYVR